MYCNNCGEEIREGVAFCPSCGCKISNRKGESKNNSNSSFSGIDIDAVKMRTKEIAGSAAETAIGIKDKSVEKLEELNVSEAANKAAKKTKGAFGWYAYNCNRVFKSGWKDIELKHHLIWCGAHIAVILLVFVVTGIVRGNNTVTVNKSYAETTTDDTENGGNSLVESLGEVVSQMQGEESEDEAEDKSAAQELIDNAKEKANALGDEIDYTVKVLFSSLYGTWTNSSGTFTLTIGEDGTVKIADSTGTFGADAFTYTEVDDDTIRLKVASDNFFASVLSIDMDYYVNGETLTVSALGKSYELTRKK